jgi:hypothetical protein
MFVVHTLLLTATGYSLTLLMASLYRPADHHAGDLDGDHQPRHGGPRLGRLLVY